MDAHLVIETSGRSGCVGIVREGTVVREASLDAARRHIRDLASSVKAILQAEALKPAEIASVLVSLGPGSYTGLRVGLASAKAFAFAVGCPLVAVPTFHAIVEEVPPEAMTVDVVGDALQSHIFVQRFEWRAGQWCGTSELQIVRISDWTAAEVVAGPGAMMLKCLRHIAIERPSCENVWAASRRLTPLLREEMFAVEPLYLRGSSAEEKRKAQSASASIASARVS